jgi:hypothetical protein
MLTVVLTRLLLLLLSLSLLLPDCPEGRGANRLPMAEGGVGANKPPRAEVGAAAERGGGANKVPIAGGGAKTPPSRALLLLAPRLLAVSKTGIDGIKAAAAADPVIMLGPLRVLWKPSEEALTALFRVVTATRSDSRNKPGVAAIMVKDKSMLVNLPPALQSPPHVEVAALPENDDARCRPCKVMGAGGGRLGEVPVGGANRYAKSFLAVFILLLVGANDDDVCTDNLGTRFNGGGDG